MRGRQVVSNINRAQLARLAERGFETPWDRVTRENRELRERVAELEGRIAGLERSRSRAIADMHEALRRFAVDTERYTADDAEGEQL